MYLIHVDLTPDHRRVRAARPLLHDLRGPVSMARWLVAVLSER